MSTEKRAATKRLSSEGTGTGNITANLEQQQQQQQHEHTTSTAATTTQQSANVSSTSAGITERGGESNQENTPAVASGATGAGESPSPVVAAAGTDLEESPRQVIAVSASKSPAAFFNLARKFLVTNEMCDLSALEGAIVSAVDAAHLLERSQLATIVRIHTSYVTVEPKRKKQHPQQGEQDVLLMQPSRTSPSGLAVGGEVATTSDASDSQAVESTLAAARQTEAADTTLSEPATPQSSKRGSSVGRELRRARIVVTVRRTESYKRWLEENPLQAIIASEAEDEEEESMGPQHSTGIPKAS